MSKIERTQINLGNCPLLIFDCKQNKLDNDIDRFISTLDKLHEVTHFIISAMQKANANDEMIKDMVNIHDEVVFHIEKYVSIPREDQK